VADRTLAELRGLSTRVAPLANEMLYQARSVGYPLVIRALGGRRTAAQQRKLVSARRSTTMRSRHLTGDAFDIDINGMNRDAVPLWFWDMLGPWAERELGLRWGGRWNAIRDLGHFELP